MLVTTEGTPPRWVTCPACTIVDCERCDGAQLQGDAASFTGGASGLYRCEAGHEKVLTMPLGLGLPESAQCPECDGMMLPLPAAPMRH